MSEKIFQGMKWIGAAYLFYLGITSFFSKESNFAEEGNTAVDSSKSLLSLYLHGFLIGITNPKGLLFFSAFLPQFLDPKAAQIPQFFVMGLTFLVFETFWLMFYSNFAAKVAPWLRAQGRAKIFNRITGGIFIVAGTLLATVKRS